jgi:AhpD family alkylhydroperoxidase
MTQQDRFLPRTVETAPDAARPILRGAAQQFGFVPAPLARAAIVPGVLSQVLSGLRAFEHTSLSTIEREVVALSVAYEQGCDYCMALHSALLSRTPEDAPVLAALRGGTPLPDARLEALRGFARELLLERGRVGEPAWQRFVQAGFSEAQALEVVQGVGAYVLSTLLNVVVQAPLDPAFAAFEWARPTSTESVRPSAVAGV